MHRSQSWSAVAAGVLGAVAALGFAPFDLWWLALAALCGWVWLVDRAAGARAGFGLGWAFGVGHIAAGLAWIATAFGYQAAMPAWMGWVAVVGLSMFLALYPALAAALTVRFGRTRTARVLLLAAAWMLTEYLRGVVFTGFAWNPLGSLWLPVAGMAQGAAVVGAIGLSGLAILMATTPLLLTRHPLAISVFASAVTAAALLVPSDAPLPLTPTRLHIVQPNIDQEDKYGPAAQAAIHARLTRAALARGPGVVIWPEGAVPEFVEEDALRRAALARLIPPGALLLFGGTAIERGRTGQALAARNSLYAIASAPVLLARYDKAHLVPGGEYLPLRALAEPLGLARVVPGDLDYWPGPGPRTLRLPGAPPVAVQICYEIIFPGQVVDRADRPAWLLTVSNDAWFGRQGPPQHFAQARLRAIEEGLPVVRSTTNGISGLIDPRGRVVASIPSGEAGVITAALPAALGPPPFARAGHLTTLTFTGLLAGLALWADRRRSRGPAHTGSA